ncbi:MAG TPA: hypothetical protein VGD83_08965 [Streptosporangiaceae bacterium]
MRSSTFNATPGPVPADQAATGAPVAGNARRTALTRIARLVRVIAEIVTVILLGECGVPPAEAATGLAATRRRRAGGS